MRSASLGSLVIIFILAGPFPFVGSAHECHVAPRAKSVVGRLHLFAEVHSPQLGNERSIRVWVPADYEKEKSRRYPVIYFHDGQNGFDASTSDGGAEWRLDETLTRLMAQEKARAAIIVGIDSFNDDRTNEYDPHAKGAHYAKFLIETVKPLIDREFRTLSSREDTFTMGSSMGAVISVALVWSHPEVFSAAAALSLPAFIRSESILRWIEEEPTPRLPIRIYMDHGTVEGEERYAAPAAKFHEALREKGFGGDELVYRVFEGAAHTEVDWSKRVEHPLEWILKSK